MVFVLQNWVVTRLFNEISMRCIKEKLMRAPHPIVVEETPRSGVIGDPAVKEVPRNTPPIRVASLLSDFFKLFVFCMLFIICHRMSIVTIITFGSNSIQVKLHIAIEKLKIKNDHEAGKDIRYQKYKSVESGNQPP